MKFKSLTIQYIIYEVLDKEKNSEEIVHQISPERILAWLQRKNFIIRRDDIVQLLKEDGAHFFEDSVRIFDLEELSYFQLPADFYQEVDQEAPQIELKLWMKSTHPNFRKRLEDLGNDVRGLKVQLKNLTESLPNEIKNTFEELNKEVQNLKRMNQVFFSQLSKLRERQSSRSLENPDEGGNENTLEDEKIETADSMPEVEPTLRFQTSDSRGYDVIDIALMYSEPLVKLDANGIQSSLGEPVEFEEECNELIQVLRQKENSVNVYFEIASYENLVNVLSLKPTILHIICHGDFNRANGHFYLCFEHNAALREFYSEDLQDILKDTSLSIKLVFVNACHSEEVAKVFHNAGIPCVIAVQSELKIDDLIAKKFSKTFYKQLVEGKTINEAFMTAQKALKADSVYTCCCAHSHEADCEWYKMAKRDGFEKAHYYHTRNCIGCKDTNRFLHEPNCKWAADFLYNVCNKQDFPTFNGLIHTCCCKPGLEHDERLKFTLLVKNEKSKNQVLFNIGRPRGPISIKSAHSCVDQKFPVKRLTGRTFELYTMYQLLTDKTKRYSILHGSEGVGKSTFVKQLANYLWERNYFQDKIAIIILDKNASIANFQSALFKEIDGSYDLKTFCESIKARHMLFIIENCDDLIEKHTEDLKLILAFIRQFAINLKFVFVTSKELKLGLGDEAVWMKGFKKIEAAKVLAQSAYFYLDYTNRNPYQLQDHPIFDHFPLTPQGVWAICELLKGINGKTLDEIVKLKQIEARTKADNLSERDENTRTSLEKIKNVSPEAYLLLLFICLFPSGLSFRDLHEMEKLNIIHSDWQNFLYFLLSREQDEDANCQPKVPHMEPNSPDKYTFFKCDNYFWINVSRDSVEDEIYFVPSQFVSRYIEQHLMIEITDLIIRKFEYLSIMSKTIIQKMLYFYEYNEKLIEFSSVSKYGIWSATAQLDFDIMNPQNIISHFGNTREGLLKIKKVFSQHEGNFASCLSMESLVKIFNSPNANLELLSHRLEVLLLNIPTVFKVMLREADAKDFAARAGYIVDSYLGHVKGTRKEAFHTLKAKLLLFLSSLYLTSKRNLETVKRINIDETKSASDFQIVSIYLDDAERAISHITTPLIKNFLIFEIKFAKAALFFKIYKKTGKPDLRPFQFYDELSKKISECETMLPFPEVHSQLDVDVWKALQKEHDINKGDQSRTQAQPSLQNQPDLVSKGKLYTLKLRGIERYKNKDLDKQTFVDVRLAALTFKIYGAEKLVMKINYLSASLRLQLEIRNYTSAKQSNNRLVEVKNQYLIKSALEIAKKISDKTYESKIKKKIDEFNNQIRKGYYNVILLMRASPLVESQIILDAANPKAVEELKEVGFPIRMVSSFKPELIDMLSKRGKALSLGFEILTRNKLTDALNQGCRILQLNCQQSDNSLPLEGDYGKMDRMYIDEMREIFKSAILSSATSSNNTQIPQQESKVFDILILGMKNSEKLAEVFINELSFPHVITFSFSSLEYDLRHKLLEDECIDKFCIFFYDELIQERSIQEAFDHAKQRTFILLADRHFEGKTREHVHKIIGPGPLLLPEGKDLHIERIFHSDQFPLLKGKVEDISSTRYPSNLARFHLPFVGRNKDIHLLMKRIYEKRGFLKIPASAGAGKTALITQTAYYLLTRDKFKDGIYYLPMKRIRQNQNSAYDLNDLLKETFGLEVSTPLSFFREKDMLLIFDDFDYFYEKDAEFPRLLFMQLRECKITCVFVTTSKPTTKKRGKADEIYQRKKEDIEKDLGLDQQNKWRFKMLTKDELANIIIALAKPDKHLELTTKKLAELPIMEVAQGNPKFVIDKLVEGKLEFNKRKLEINPIYEKHVNLDSKYLQVNKFPNTPDLTRSGSIFTLSDSTTKLNRTVSEATNIGQKKPPKSQQIYPPPTELKSAKSVMPSQIITLPSNAFILGNDDDKSVKSQPTGNKKSNKKKPTEMSEIPPSRYDFNIETKHHIDEVSFEEEKSHNATHSNHDHESSAGEKSVSAHREKISDEGKITIHDTSTDDIDQLEDSFFHYASEEDETETEIDSEHDKHDKFDVKKLKTNGSKGGGSGNGNQKKVKKSQSGKQVSRYKKSVVNKYNDFKNKKSKDNDENENEG